MSLDPNISYWISMIIYDELQKCCNMLTLNGEDRKVYETCMQDFRNYLLYLERNHLKISDSSNHESTIHEEDVGEIIFGMITNRLFGLQESLESTREITEFIRLWVRWWWKKWQERTKIVFKEIPRMINTNIPLPSNQFTKEECDDLIQIMTEKFIQYGEICCNNILANALFKKDIQASQKTKWTVQDKLNLIPRLQREAREMSYTHGALIFIKPDKGYGLREWRDDNANKII